MLGFSDTVAPDTCWFKCRLLVFRLLFFRVLDCQVDCCHFHPTPHPVLIFESFLLPVPIHGESQSSSGGPRGIVSSSYFGWAC